MEIDQAIKFMRDVLKVLVDKKGSDLFITVDFPPAIKVDGKIAPVSKTRLFRREHQGPDLRRHE